LTHTGLKQAEQVGNELKALIPPELYEQMIVVSGLSLNLFSCLLFSEMKTQNKQHNTNCRSQDFIPTMKEE
jgi:hypothetical protein